MATFTLPQTDVQSWQATTTAPILRAFYNATFTAASGIVVPKGSPRDPASAYKSVTTTLLANVVTIPSFTILSTRDGLDNRFATVSFHWYGSDGHYIGPFGSYVNMQVPSLISSVSGCTPSGTCCSFAELYNYNFSAPAIPSDTVYSKIEVDRLVLANIGAGGIGGSGASPRIPFFTAGSVLSSDSSLTWDNTAKQLTLGATARLESLANALEGSTDYRGMGFQRGTALMSVETNSDPYLNYQVHQNNNGTGTLFNYYFSAETHEGTRPAIYNLVGVMKARGTGSHDRVAVAGLGYAMAGTTDRVWSFYAQAETNSATGTALNEFLVYNTSGVQAQTAQSGLTPSTLGLSIVGAGANNNSAALTISSQGTGSFLSGLYFYGGALASGATAIDLSPLGSSIVPINLSQLSYIKGRNFLNSANVSLIGINAADEVSIPNMLRVTAGSAIPMVVENGAAASTVLLEFASNTVAKGYIGWVTGLGNCYLNSAANVPLLLLPDIASGVNYPKLSTAVTGSPIKIEPDGSDTNIGVTVKSKAVGNIILDPTGGNVAVGTGVLATNATAGFFCLPTAAGPPSGTPGSLASGLAAFCPDTVNDRLYAYYGGAWHNLTASGAGTGTVTSVSVVTANGVSGSVASPTTVPAITLTLGAITPTTVNGLTITANGTNTLNIVAGGSLITAGAFATTITSTNTTNSTLPAGTHSLAPLDTPVFTTNITAPIHYGGSAAGSTLSLFGTSNVSPASAHVLMNTVASGLQPGVVGIGAAAASFILGDVAHLQGPDATSAFVTIDSYGTGAVSAIVGRHANNTAASPTAAASGETLVSLAGRGYYVTGGPAFSSSGNAAIQLKAAQDFTSTALGTRITFETTPTGSASRSIKWQIEPDGALLAMIDNTQNIGATSATRPAAIFLGAPSITPGSGTGITVNDSGSVRYLTYKVTLSFTALAAAQLTADSVIAVLPAKTRLVSILVDVTTPFTGGAVSAATMTVGKTTGGAEYIASFDCFTAAIRRGLIDADMGTAMTRANAVQGGDLPSWTATTSVSLRLTCVTAFTNACTAGSVSIYLSTEQFQ